MNTKTKPVQKYQWITVTIEAKAALDTLPSHVKMGQLLVDFGLIEKSAGYTIGFKVSTVDKPHHSQHVRSIRIINLCNAYNEFIERVHQLNIKDL